jgi:threonine dehydrogenase-like Zn-dependent dehydrogenase
VLLGVYEWNLVMRAVRRTDYGIETLDVARREGEGIRVHVRSAGVCGSDLYAMRLGPSPVTLGHEVGGLWEPVQIGPKAMLKEVDFRPATYSGHHHGESEFEQAARILAATPQAGEVLVTHRFPLERAAEAVAVAADKSTGAKVQQHP